MKIVIVAGSVWRRRRKGRDSKVLFVDFEVFKHDWLAVIINANTQQEHVIVNDPEKLAKIYEENKRNIWVGFNIKHYDQWILKAILCGFNPKEVNDFIIEQNQPGWKYSSLLNKINLIIYDVMLTNDRGLKVFEGFMGHNIKESSVPFNIERKLTPEEIEETIKYCRHDVEETIKVFLHRKDEFEAHLGLVKLACKDKPLNLNLLSRTKVQLAAIILDATKREYDDEFDIDFPPTLKINKYKSVLDWYADPNNRRYFTETGEKNQLEVMVAGVPHVFGWGGLHGAREKYHGEGFFLNMDVASLYPSLMIRYELSSRSIKDPKKYEEIYHTRLKYKAEGNPLQLPLKLVLNGTYGAMKDPNNPLYDPRQANRVCVYGQLLLLDLIEKLEPHCELIQSNTDGLLIKLPDTSNETFYQIADICKEWEERTGLQLEFEEYCRVFQKDVNNYVIVDVEGNYKSKGAYVKQLNDLDYDLPIVNKALINKFIHNIPVEQTINNCDDLREFQMIAKITHKYTHLLYGRRKLIEKCIRVFASKNYANPGIFKVNKATGKPEKFPDSPEHCFIFNDDVTNVKVPQKLDKQWYINLANKRLKGFGGDVGNMSLF